MSWPEIVNESSKIITFTDLAGRKIFKNNDSWN